MAHHFFLSRQIKLNKPVLLEEEDSYHVTRVLRLKKGDSISLADVTGQGYMAEIDDIYKGRVTVLARALLPDSEPGVRVTLFQGWPKGDKLDYIIEKCTELGIYGINVLVTGRSIPSPGRDSIERRRVRWHKKALAAACQSRRHMVPEVRGPMGLEEALAQISPGTLLIMPWEEEKTRSLQSVLSVDFEKRDIAVIVGPEGGFSKEEADLVMSYGGIAVTLGPRVLRTETAGLVCLAAIMYAAGELS